MWWELALIGIAILLGLVGVYVFIVMWHAKESVADMPRREAFICPVHGPMPVSSTITLFGSDLEYATSEDGRTQRGPVRKCSICMEEAFKKARAQR